VIEYIEGKLLSGPLPPHRCRFRSHIRARPRAVPVVIRRIRASEPPRAEALPRSGSAPASTGDAWRPDRGAACATRPRARRAAANAPTGGSPIINAGASGRVRLQPYADQPMRSESQTVCARA
jgi:hypothetical protein